MDTLRGLVRVVITTRSRLYGHVEGLHLPWPTCSSPGILYTEGYADDEPQHEAELDEPEGDENSFVPWLVLC